LEQVSKYQLLIKGQFFVFFVVVVVDADVAAAAVTVVCIFVKVM
jgi:NADH:ubiquinone oxidoreductase subunit K